MYPLHPLQTLCMFSTSCSTQIYWEDSLRSSADGEVKLGRKFQLETPNFALIEAFFLVWIIISQEIHIHISRTRFKYSACMFSNSCSRRHIYREDNFRCSMSVSYLYRIKSLWHIYRWRTFAEISVWCFLSSISQFALMIVMETKFTTFAVFRANEGETSPPGDGKSTSCEISSGRWIPIETKKSRDPKRNMLPSQVSVNLSKGCWDWVQDRRNPLLCRCKMLRTPPGPYGTKLLHFFLLMSKVSPGRQKSLAPKS